MSKVVPPLFNNRILKCLPTCRHKSSSHEFVKLPGLNSYYVFRCLKCSCHLCFSMTPDGQRERVVSSRCNVDPDFLASITASRKSKKGFKP